jgi:hypothetical protein
LTGETDPPIAGGGVHTRSCLRLGIRPNWDVHHALVAAVRRLVKLAGGVQEAKDVIDAIAAADALEEEKEEQ